MKINELKNHEIRRKPHVEAEYRTEGKDEAAEYIEQEVLEAGRWPVDMQDIAEETGWARQHIANTIRDYFEAIDESPEVSIDDDRAVIEFSVPPMDDEEAYVRGYLRGWLDGGERR